LLRSRARWWGKRLELVKEAVPRAGRIAVLSHGDAGSRSMIQEAQKAAPSLGVKLIVVEVRNGDYDGAFARIAGERPDALFVLPTTFFFRDMKPIIALAAGHRLPAIYERPSRSSNSRGSSSSASEVTVALRNSMRNWG
jgi:ABC-type uncharacterized transport system substrate-binding protein